MKSKKILAQIAAFSLVFGMTGVGISFAQLDGTSNYSQSTGTVTVDIDVTTNQKIELNGDAKLNLKNLTLQHGGELYADWQSTVNADTISVEDGAKFQGVGRSIINVKNLRIGSNPARIRVRDTFEGRVTDINGNSLSKQKVKESFLLNSGDKTSLEFQDPEVDHTLVLHMNTDGGLTMQGKDFSQADKGNTRTYIMASWSANGDYNAEGHNIKNVNSLYANRLVINGTDITDSLRGAVDVSGKIDKNVSELKVSKADANASNIDAAAYTAKLNTGKVEDGNMSLVSGGAVWNAIKDVKNSTGEGWVKVNGDTVAIASDEGATKVSVAGKNGDRVLTGVKTDEKDASSAANVGYVNSTAISLTDSMNAMNSKLSDDIKNAGAVGGRTGRTASSGL